METHEHECMTRSKRILRFLLALILVLSILPARPAQAASYVDSCTAYRSHLSVRTNTATTLMSLPCNADTNSSSSKIGNVSTDTALTVTALYQNTAGEYWYKTSYSGTTCYVNATHTTMQSQKVSDVTATDVLSPASLGYGEIFSIGGTVTASKNTLTKVTAAMYRGTDTSAAPAIQASEGVTGNSYTLGGSTVDANLSFGSLAAGDYTYLLTATAQCYYINTGGALAKTSRTTVLERKSCIITNASSPNPVTAMGIDVSEWQGSINWSKAASQVDFAILRASWETTVDGEFYDNADGCTENGVPFGVYVYSYALTPAQAVAEAEYVLGLVSNYDLALPIYYDLEESSQAALGGTKLTAIVKAFCETIKAAGYEPGIYSSLSWYNSYYTDPYFDTLPKWVAQLYTSCTYTGGVRMWQYSWEGAISGISGDVDCNYYYGIFDPDSTTSSGSTSTPIVSGNTTVLSSAPNALVNYDYSSGVSCGTIRYMSQIASSKYFYSDYWDNWISQASIECGTASISMALSYIGIDRDPDYILDYGNGGTYFGESWGGATYLTPTVSTAMSNYINGGGKYSPPIIHLDNYSTLGHYVVLAGKISGTTYQVLDPAQNSTWNITFNGNTATYTRNGYTVTDTVTYASQYYNPSASLETKLTEPVISGCSVPTELKVGDVFTVAGTVYAPSAITKVTVGCYDTSGNAMTSASAAPGTTSYNIGNLDYYVEFNTLAAGAYYYKVTVTTASGTTTLVNSRFTVADPNAITISGHSIPTTMSEGEVFIVKGTVKSGLKLTKVTVGCYDANGTMLTGSSATPNATSYSLANLDAYVEFNTLAAGTYYYKVKATNSAGTTTLVNAKFTVTDENAMTLTGSGTPGVLTVGSPFPVKGVIDSGTVLTKVTVGCYDATGTMLTGASATPNATTYDVSNLDAQVRFDELEPGIYRYQVTATNSGGSNVLQNTAFTVLATGRTVADGLYALVPSSSTGYALHVAGDSTASGANVELAVKATSEFMAMRVKHIGGGYYTLQFFGSSKLLTVENAGTANSTNVNQATSSGTDSQKWQILPTGKGYCLVPKHATTKALDIRGGTMAAGTNVQIYTRKLSNAQQFNLEKMDVSKVTISGHSVPTTITVGGVFSVKGTITANEKLTKVTVGCYDVNGKLLTGASAAPNAKTYNVANLDYDVEFNILTPGIYYYRITTVTASGSKRIINAAFTVLATGRTVADGVYTLRSVGNSGYAVDVAGSSNKNSANVDLGTRSTASKYQAIRVKYVGSGCYTLQFVGSGMYLTVAGGGTSSGTNVRQNVPNSSNYQKWQILPAGSGYCLVPKHATTMALDIKGGTYTDGTNVQMYKRSLSKAQRFTLEASTAAKSKLTGCSTPTTLSVGGVYTVKGTITSTETITKVQVQVVNAGGTVLTGASATPKTKSYNIGSLDYYVEFNILPKGTYYYKISATTASGTEVLVNSRFVVK